MKYPLVSIVIVNWNGQDILKACLSEVKNLSYKNIEVIVVDNNSSDDSLRIIQSFKGVKLVKNKKNLGFAGGNNSALKSVRGKYVLLLNSDTHVTKDVVSVLVREIEKKSNIGVIQPKILYKGNEGYENNTINSIGADFTRTGFLYYFGYGKQHSLKKYNKKREIFSAYGACMLIRKEVIDSIGLFDNDFFVYFEETDFCMRVWMQGHKIMFEPKAFIYHKGGESARKYGTSQIIFHSFKNRLCSYSKNLELRTLLTVFILHIPLCFAIALVYLLKGKISLFIAVLRAFYWNIKNLPKTLEKRRHIQHSRIIDDRVYLPSVTAHPRISYFLYLLRGLQYYKD